jgi:hypothetical protein
MLLKPLLAILLAANAPTQLMIVGMAHLVARHDVHNSKFSGDPRSPQRQAQIAQIVERLARFHPTKVLIEDPDGDPKVIASYKAFVSGHFILPPGEDYQIGFRLARAANDPTIYPADTWGPTLALLDEKTAAGKRNIAYLTKALPNVSSPAFDGFIAKSNELEQTGTYLDVLRYINTDAAIRANAGMYSVFAGLGGPPDSPGAAYVAQWYTRNTFIWANILRAIKPGDRVVVLFGQGHEYLLREFARMNPNIEYVDPLTYLR